MPSKRVVTDASCPSCSTSFPQKTWMHQYCSVECWLAIHRPTPPRPASMTCRECGDTFAPTRHDQRYCAQRCSRKAEKRRSHYRARRKAWEANRPIGIAELGDRDGWRCHIICLRRVDSTKPANHPLSPTCDHLIPIADGGTDDLANLALAHMVCNARRGSTGAAQLRLA